MTTHRCTHGGAPCKPPSELARLVQRYQAERDSAPARMAPFVARALAGQLPNVDRTGAIVARSASR